MWTYNYNYNNELYHFGIKGMKWGVRRYQNYDGSYTRAGLKRYDDSLAKYEKADKRYKDAKSNYKNAKKSGSSTDGMKTEIANSKLTRKKAKSKLVKDYKHLKLDKLGDEGKKLYSNGKTITGNDEVTSALNKLGAASLSAVAFNSKTGAVTQAVNEVMKNVGHKQINQVLNGIGVTALAVSGIKRVVDERQNKRLRAYYSHSSNY